MKLASGSKGPEAAGGEQGITLGDVKWAAWVPIGLCLVLVGWLFTPSFIWWYGIWMRKDSYYSHGILVPFICAFIVWLQRQSLGSIALRPAVLGFVVLVPALVLTVLALWGGALSLTGLMFPVVLAALSIALLGKVFTRALAFPLGYLYFMCVLPGFVLTAVSFRIQMLSTAGAAMILRVVSLDAYRQGAVITLPNVEVLVGSPCSGFRLLISFLALAVLIAYLAEGPVWGRLLIVGFALPLSLVLNSVRIALIAVVGELMGTQAMRSFHNWSGYLILVAAFFLFFLFARLVKCENFRSMPISPQ